MPSIYPVYFTLLTALLALCEVLIAAKLPPVQYPLMEQNILYSILDVIGTSLSTINATTAPDWGLDIQETTHKYGYKIEDHEITTEDGYILKIHHLSDDTKNRCNSKRPVVFLMHPLATSSRIWVCLGPKSLGYTLVDAGYDVWMGNARGTRFGRMHVKMDPNNDPEFWNFSFDEVGYYDLPAMIDHVLNRTKMQNLIYIGHSQGNSAFFDMASRRPAYNDKIKLSVAVGPAVFITGTQTQVGISIIKVIFELFGIQELFRPGPLIPQIGRLLCSGERFNLCLITYELLFGYTTAVDPKMMPLVLCNGPEGFSLKMLLHYSQLMKTGEFTRYDYGYSKNIEKYGQQYPPQINVSKVTSPVAIFYTKYDIFAPQEKLKLLKNVLPNLQLMYKIKSKYFNHADFVVGENRDELFHKPLISYLDSIVRKSDEEDEVIS